MGTRHIEQTTCMRKRLKETLETSSTLLSHKIKNRQEKEIIIKNENSTGILSLPIEILFEIFSYLGPQDLYSIRDVSKYFSRLVDEPSVWKTYEVKENGPDTHEVIEQLKKMPLLERISINRRPDCDDILHQLSLTNRKLERLNIVDCTGSTGKLYLRAIHLTRILERCRRLHTIHILGSRFRGQKFYRLLGDMKTRLRTLSSQATSSQFRTFVKHAYHLDEHNREVMCAMCTGQKAWAPLRYFMLERTYTSDQRRPFVPMRRTVLVSYFYSDFVSIDVSDNDRHATTNERLQSCP
ncbi:hypothetical protein PV325_011293 [Microctonus aethiopoides]|nr:hypothetical protein PV325_011293 [Microctonus aethiopoides]KAK0092624.1 hypothetical protein PV326_001012 [Microctonus aethiopoides]